MVQAYITIETMTQTRSNIKCPSITLLNKHCRSQQKHIFAYVVYLNRYKLLLLTTYYLVVGHIYFHTGYNLNTTTIFHVNDDRTLVCRNYFLFFHKRSFHPLFIWHMSFLRKHKTNTHGTKYCNLIQKQMFFGC